MEATVDFKIKHKSMLELQRHKTFEENYTYAWMVYAIGFFQSCCRFAIRHACQKQPSSPLVGLKV